MASAYTRTTSSVPLGRTKARPDGMPEHNVAFSGHTELSNVLGQIEVLHIVLCQLAFSQTGIDALVSWHHDECEVSGRSCVAHLSCQSCRTWQHYHLKTQNSLKTSLTRLSALPCLFIRSSGCSFIHSLVHQSILPPHSSIPRTGIFPRGCVHE